MQEALLSIKTTLHCNNINEDIKFVQFLKPTHMIMPLL